MFDGKLKTICEVKILPWHEINETGLYQQISQRLWIHPTSPKIVHYLHLTLWGCFRYLYSSAYYWHLYKSVPDTMLEIFLAKIWIHLFWGFFELNFWVLKVFFLLDRTKRTSYEEWRAWCNMSLITSIINCLIILTLNINFSPIQQLSFHGKFLHSVNKF
jgi:hypothetical protein